MNAKLEERRVKEAQANADPSGWAIGLRYGSEFLGGIFAGAGLGFIADHFLGTSPWGLLAGTMLGFAAGTLNIVRAAKELNKTDSGPEGGAS